VEERKKVDVVVNWLVVNCMYKAAAARNDVQQSGGALEQNRPYSFSLNNPSHLFAAAATNLCSGRGARIVSVVIGKEAARNLRVISMVQSFSLFVVCRNGGEKQPSIKKRGID
jgi:hypothetical protein